MNPEYSLKKNHFLKEAVSPNPTYKAESKVLLLELMAKVFARPYIYDREILNIHISGSALWQMFEVVSACVVSSELISWLRQGRLRKSSFGRNFPLSGQQIATDKSMASFLADCWDSFFYFTFLLSEWESLCFSCFALILSLPDWCTWNKNNKLHSFQSNSRWVHKKMRVNHFLPNLNHKQWPCVIFRGGQRKQLWEEIFFSAGAGRERSEKTETHLQNSHHRSACGLRYLVVLFTSNHSWLPSSHLSEHQLCL